jgi:hypothetical protein
MPATCWVPASPSSTTSRPASNRMSPALSVSSRMTPDGVHGHSPKSDVAHTTPAPYTAARAERPS